MAPCIAASEPSTDPAMTWLNSAMAISQVTATMTTNFAVDAAGISQTMSAISQPAKTPLTNTTRKPGSTALTPSFTNESMTSAGNRCGMETAAAKSSVARMLAAKTMDQ